MAALLAWLARVSGAHSPAVTTLGEAVIDRFARDRTLFSDILEMSFSCDARGEHLYRFSYAFPGFRGDETSVSSSLLAFCHPFGPRAVEAAQTTLRAARSPAVAQILFGFAHDAGEAGQAWRVKFYLQFADRAGSAALKLATRILGPQLGGLSRAGRLHLMCLDVGEHGLAAAKLYFVQDRLALDAMAATVGDVPLLGALADLGVSSLRDVLTIHRVAGPEDAAFLRASEVDFSLPDNDLLWDDVRRLPYVKAHLARSPALTELAAGFKLATRRVSGSVGDGRKLTVYYTLAERERPRVTALA
jgi:hypothetical protein